MVKSWVLNWVYFLVELKGLSMVEYLEKTLEKWLEIWMGMMMVELLV
jgi:hypothetical protein